jgi:hypothetical protein
VLLQPGGDGIEELVGLVAVQGDEAGRAGCGHGAGGENGCRAWRLAHGGYGDAERIPAMARALPQQGMGDKTQPGP